jgi:hypothetical protein
LNKENFYLSLANRSGELKATFFSKIAIVLAKRALKQASKKGIERNLLAKKFIQKIIYSKQSIEIVLFYPVKNSVFNRIYAENPKDFQKLSGKNKTALLSQGGGEFFSEARASSPFNGLETATSPFASEKEQFAILNTGG